FLHSSASIRLFFRPLPRPLLSTLFPYTTLFRSAGIAGGLWISWLGGVRLDFFLFQLTFFFLVAISAGGTGSITGVLMGTALVVRSEEHTSELQSRENLVCRLLLEKKNSK